MGLSAVSYRILHLAVLCFTFVLSKMVLLIENKCKTPVVIGHFMLPPFPGAPEQGWLSDDYCPKGFCGTGENVFFKELLKKKRAMYARKSRIALIHLFGVKTQTS